MISFVEKLFEPRSNTPEVTKLLADLLKVKITSTRITKEIEEHPDYPSLLSISDVLKNHGVENLAIQLNPDLLQEIPTPFITPIKQEHSQAALFTVVRYVEKDSISFFDPEKHTWTTTNQEYFIKRFSGTVLIAEVGENAGEKEYSLSLQEEKRKRFIRRLITFSLPTILLTTGFFAFIQNGINALLPFLFSIITLSGTAIGALLLWYELDQYNPVLQQICSAGKKVNCGAVIQSKASKIAGISWSIIGMTYFIGILLMQLCTGLANTQTLFIISWINLLALPYIFFSIYYQWKIAKQWCILCLGVQAALLIQFILAFIGSWYNLSDINATLLLSAISAFTIPFIALMLLMPALNAAKENKHTNNELQRLKHNQQIFDALLSKEKAVTVPSEGLGIILGNPEAKYKLIKVCSPYCLPCSNAHAPMKELLENNNDLQIQIIFTAYDNEADISALPAKHLLAINEKGDDAITKQALNDWYSPNQKEYEIFAEKHPVDDLKIQSDNIASMRDWCDKMEISFTPTFFVNGYQLPQIYSVHDLKYFLSV